MTGFGKAAFEYEGKKIAVEIKSLNSKQIDISTRVASQYREKDIEIRNELSQKLERGKIDFLLYIDNSGKEAATQINQSLVASYYNQIKSASETLGIDAPANWFDILLRLPDAMKTENPEINENEWLEIQRVIQQAIEQLREFRIQEGKTLQAIFEEKINNIKNLLDQIALFEAERLEKIKSRLEENLQSISEKIEYDKNRLEQELIFYIEKLDITEEKVRLRKHCDYFMDTMKENNAGKKLGFIIQEMGREINTIGSKANDFNIQQIVVLMKDEAEKMKEQLANIL